MENRKAWWVRLLTAAAVAMVVCSYLLYVASSQRARIEAELERESQILHRIVSQRADQHDPHLTSLSALAVSGAMPQTRLVRQVAGAIRQFYPRVAAIDLIALQGDGYSITTRTAAADIDAVSSAAVAAALRSTGRFELLPSPAAAARYLIVKRSPNTEAARFALVLEIDARALVETDADFWNRPGASIRLELPDGSALLSTASDPSVAQAGQPLARRLTTRRTLGSRTQPLLLTTGFAYGAADLFPAGPMIGGLAVIGALFIAAVLVLRLIAKSRSAELRARLGEQDAKIAHASRVNALGEIASGMAHELNQPLTAILSQSQAGVRLLAHPDTDPERIAEILRTTITQAKRAADIIVRLREWTRTTTPELAPLSVNRCVDNVAFLLGTDSRRLGIVLQIRTDPLEPMVLGDSVEMEQVLFNLVRNAIDALASVERADKRILVSSRKTDGMVVVQVSDNGPGIDPQMRKRLFEPFVTDKEKGMGLGLVLCERIVQRMNGELEVHDGAAGGISVRIRLPAAPRGV